jgi:hypothetical protein
MHPEDSGGSIRVTRSFPVFLIAVTVFLSPLLAQDAVNPPKKPSPPKIETQIFVVGEPVVQVQWAHSLNLVNAPQNVTLLNPGQCIRVAAVASGDNRDTYLDGTKISFRVRFNGQAQNHPLAAFAQTRQIKPEGGDFVTAVLAAARIKSPVLTMVSLGVSADKWCVPADAADGKATIEAEVETPDGSRVLTPANIQIESFETGSKNQFKDVQEFSNVMQTYYRQPNPARLLPALQFLVADPTIQSHAGTDQSAAAFIRAAIKADPLAGNDLLARMPAQEPVTRWLGLLILRSAGYDIAPVLKTFSAENKQKFESLHPLADPYDLTPTIEVVGHLDLMWSTFGATGQFEPVKTIASTLAWRSDYEEFDKMRKSGTRPSQITPSLARGLAYMAAGWSMGSFQRNDPLVADYIEYMLASPDISPAIKSELAGLSTNPAFQRDTKK